MNHCNSADLYIDLLKKTLMHSLWDTSKPKPSRIPEILQRVAPRIFGRRNRSESELEGRTWPELAHTMIGGKRLNHLHWCVEQVLESEVPGDFIETGVWRGGSCILMRGVLKARGISDRKVWVADSFQGLPKPNPQEYPQDCGDRHHTYGELAVSRADVEANFRAYGLLDEQVEFLQGWFSDTLPSAPIEKLALCRLDGDMYESTMDALAALYPRLSVGGFLIVDDYGAVPACKLAVQEFRELHGICEPISEIDWTGIYWRKLNEVPHGDG